MPIEELPILSSRDNWTEKEKRERINNNEQIVKTGRKSFFK